MPPESRIKAVEELAFIYSPWFFEAYARFDSGDGTGLHPLVLEDFQIKYLLDNSIFKITNKTRQAGASLMVSMQKLYKAYRTPGYRCSIISINLKEAVDKIRYIRRIHDSLPDKFKVPLSIDNAHSIGFHTGSNQSIIESVAASRGVRGGQKEVVFDEFAHIELSRELLFAAAPAIINGNLTLDIISTPKGNLDTFSEIWFNRPNQDEEAPWDMFSHHQFIWCDVRRFVQAGRFEECQHVWYNELHENMDYMRDLVKEFGSEKLKYFYRSFPWSQFLQEFCGVFLDETNVFFPQSLIMRCLRPEYAKIEYSDDDIAEEKEYLDPWSSRPEGNTNQVFMGIDYGESSEDTDKTSIQILELDAKTGILMHRYSEVLHIDNYPDFPSQGRHIIDVAKRFQPTKISADDTGLGRGINPFIQEKAPHLPFEEVNFNLTSKEEMVMKLKTVMEQGKIWIQQKDTMLQGQIRGIERKLTEHGRASYSGKPHDDMFWALALAARAGSYMPFAIYRIGGGPQRNLQAQGRRVI